MVINRFLLRKISEDYKAVSSKFVISVPAELIELENTLNEITDLINLEEREAEPDTRTIEALQAQRVRTRQRLAAIRTKYGI